MKRIGSTADPEPSTAGALIVALRDPALSSLDLAGGKAARLGALLRAGFAVPDGFCVTTAAYACVAQHAQLDKALDMMAACPPGNTARLAGLAFALQHAIIQTTIPKDVAGALLDAYHRLPAAGHMPVAVRSSATAEDLPDASFAGQQETLLNVIGDQALLAAVQRCWASLWTERAAQYRAQLGIDPRSVRLAVVVQPMVDAEVAGVLFSANPFTGRRRQTVIDATPGLGEAVVSGLSTPDHFVVDTGTGAVLERRLGEKQIEIRAERGGGTRRLEQPGQATSACLSDTQLRELCALGAQVEQQVGAPVDIEWAFDGDGRLWLLQARPITTLFPLPDDAPAPDTALRVYLSFTVQQGTEQPFTPMGLAALRLLASGLTTFLGQPPRDARRGPPFVTEAGSRLFLDVTGALRHTVGRRVLAQVMAQAEAHAAAIFADLSADPRLALVPASRLSLIRTLGRLLIRTRLPWHLLLALVRPATARERLLDAARRLGETAAVADDAGPRARLAAVEQLCLAALPRLLSAAAPVMLGGMGTLALAGRLLGTLATAAELQIIAQGLPGNPTTEMNLALWELAQTVRPDDAAAAVIRDTSPEQLAAAFQAGELPQALQAGLTHFLARYGHRSVNELDLGVARWRDDPSYLFGLLAGYLRIDSPAQALDRQLQRVEQDAEAMRVALTRRASRSGWLRGLLVGFLLRRARALGGMRELPRSILAGLLAEAQTLLIPVGALLVQNGHLTHADDIFWLQIAEAHAALDGVNMRQTVRERRATYEQERRRRHVPLVLLSDGTEPAPLAEAPAMLGVLVRGTPASPGIVTGRARVIRNPVGAQLEAGEILVAPTTDPGWTPLFLTAGGLVMETGGVMAHGAIVAREYGLPVVVGAPGATTRITTGQLITIDGTAGVVHVAEGWEG